MGLLRIIATVAFAGVVAGVSIPRSFGVPTTDGFPSPDTQQRLSISEKAGGRGPDGQLPSTLGAGSMTALQLITANELFETAYFASLLSNITNNVAGYEGDGQIANIISTVLAQEQSHALAARDVLDNADAFAPDSCKYQFPVATLKDAILVAETFTAAVLGALQGANVLFAKDNVLPLVQIVSSVIGQEGEQNGFYRYKLDLVPSESPFLTYVPAAFAWSALQLFVVPGSCPYPLSKINLPIFTPLLANGGPIAVLEAKDQVIHFSANLTGCDPAQSYIGGDGKGLYATFTVGQLTPVSKPIENVSWKGDVISFDASFDYTELVAHGFSHAALTTADKFQTGDEVVDATLAAPALIQVAAMI